MKEESLLLLSDLQKLINQVVLIDYTIIILGGYFMVRVSKHASRRLKERCGLNKKSVQRMADIAFTNGMKQEDATGQLNRWMASLYCANMDANNIRIYGNYVYIFCGITLVTVLHVPHRLKNHVNEQKKRLVRNQEG